MLVWQGFAAAFRQHFHQEFKLEHAFSCEKAPRKQKFLLKMFPDMPRLFADCAELGGAMAWDVKTNSRQPVLAASSLFGGFPCTDASRLSHSSFSVENRSCIQNASLRTGSVFASIVRWAKLHGRSAAFIVLETVTARLTL